MFRLPLPGPFSPSLVLLVRGPGAELHVDAALGHAHAFAFEKFPLQAGMGLANQQLTAETDHSMPGDTFSRRACGHRPAGAARTAAELKSLSKPSVGDNPAARNLFHKGVHPDPGHFAPPLCQPAVCLTQKDKCRVSKVRTQESNLGKACYMKREPAKGNCEKLQSIRETNETQQKK